MRSPPERVLVLGPKEVDVALELQLEDVLLVDAVGSPGLAHSVAQQGEAGQRVVILDGDGCSVPPAPPHGQRSLSGCAEPLPGGFCRRTSRGR